MNYIRSKFSNYRGLIRTLLADIMWRLGPYRKYGRVNWVNVKRIVFICQGNICRSPFAYCLAEAGNLGMPVLSFGLATTTGLAANAVAIDVAQEFGVDMSNHRSIDLADFDVKEGDLLVVMEDRHIQQLGGQLNVQKVQICLLGLWCRPRFALLYDPFEQHRDYFVSCFDRIDRAITNLLQEIKNSGCA